MEQHSHKEIAALEQSNWWYATRRSILRNLLERFAPTADTALDVGCGVGSNYSVISESALKVIGLDISQDALDTTLAPYDEKVLASVEKMPLPDESVDIVVCFDVLEHVDDRVATKDVFRVLRPGGTAFITVPAFDSLWNENDDYGHHLRRYRKSEIVSVLKESGFELPYVNYWNRFPFFPVVWVVARFYKRGVKKENLRNNLSLIPNWLNPLLILWMHIENAIARVIPLPFGVSLVVVARKKKS